MRRPALDCQPYAAISAVRGVERKREKIVDAYWLERREEE
jgi:hypothetical protein